MRTALFLFSAALWAQTNSPQFEVATIKMAPTPDGRGYSVSSRGGPGTQDPGLFSCHNWSASSFVSNAFDLARYELSAPDWMESVRFDMSAKIPEGTTKEQFRLMMQNFLAERFKLAYHREKKEVGRTAWWSRRMGRSSRSPLPFRRPRTRTGQRRSRAR